jgi:hypothetical protein
MTSGRTVEKTALLALVVQPSPRKRVPSGLGPARYQATSTPRRARHNISPAYQIARWLNTEDHSMNHNSQSSVLMKLHHRWNFASYCERFWWWYTALRIIQFLDFFHRPVLWRNTVFPQSGPFPSSGGKVSRELLTCVSTRNHWRPSFPHSLLAGSRMVSRVGYDRFLPNPFQFISLIIRRCIVYVAKLWLGSRIRPFWTRYCGCGEK